jgi:glycosyltransferase involved in cell wall biosynthesis
MSASGPGPDAGGNGRPRLLVVPHLYAENISIREIEFARRLTRHFDIYCLAWDDALHVENESALERRWKQFRTALSAAFARRILRTSSDGVTYVTAPVLQAILVQRLLGVVRAAKMCRWFNRRTIESLTDSLHVSHILLAAETFGLPQRREVRSFFDVVDWIPEGICSPDFVKFKRQELIRMAGDAQGVFAVSEPLCEKLREDCGIETVSMPNGADLGALRAVPPAETAALRHTLGLDGKFIIGYIGNHGDYTGVGFVVDVFRRVRERIPNAALLIVGPAEYWRSLLETAHANGVIWTGPVPPAEIGKYFNVLDIGVLAQEKSLGTELAFQLKVVEYSACRKFVVSTPLRTWELLQWPNVLLTELRVEAWVEAIVKAQHSRWKPEWDAIIEEYDWDALADRMAAVLLAAEVRERPLCVS